MMTETMTCSDQRSEVRTPHRFVLILRVTDRDWAGFEPAELTDRSPNGVGILLGHAIPVGQRFLLRLRIEATLTLVPYAVCHCEQCDHGFQIGAELCQDKYVTDGHRPEKIFNALKALAAVDN